MTSKSISYLPIEPALASSGLLISIKVAADAEGCSAETLKNNAKAGRLRAFQQRFGTPVFVLRSDVVAFLQSRPDILSAHQPKLPVAPPWRWAPAPPPPLPLPLTSGSSDLVLEPDSQVPGFHPVPPLPPRATRIQLKSLEHATPAERLFLGTVFAELAAFLSPQ